MSAYRRVGAWAVVLLLPAWVHATVIDLPDPNGTTMSRLGVKATYAAGTTAKTATAAGTAPWFAICGSATKTIRVQYFEATITVATAAAYADVVLKKTSTAPSGGTATTLTQVPLDSENAAGTASAVRFYTVLPTAGSAVGVVGSRQVFAPITGTPAVDVLPVMFDWRTPFAWQGVVLRGASQCLEASFGTTTTNAPTISTFVMWTEE